MTHQYLIDRYYFEKISRNNIVSVVKTRMYLVILQVAICVLYFFASFLFLMPFLFTVFTSDCRSSSEKCPLVKFADDTAMAGLIDRDDDSALRSQLDTFVQYCDQNYLELNVAKTKEMVIDFRKNVVPPEPISIGGTEVERVSLYKYLGIMIDDRLSWGEQVDHIVGRLNPRMYCLRKMAVFQVRTDILKMFYLSTICGVWRYCIICWGGNVTDSDKQRLERIIARAERVIGEDLESVESVYQGLLRRKLARVWDDSCHPLHDRLAGQRSLRGTGRLRLPPLNTNRYRSSFIPRAIKLFNAI